MSTLSVDTIQGKTTAGTVAMPSGHIVQVLSTTKTTEQSISGSSFVDISGLSQAITPKFATSKILVQVNVSFSGEVNSYIAFKILRDSTEILKNTESNTGLECSGGGTIPSGSTENYAVHKESMSGFDSPNTTSETTYKVQISPMRTSSKVATVNRAHTRGDDNQVNTASTITLMEIKQ